MVGVGLTQLVVRLVQEVLLVLLLLRLLADVVQLAPEQESLATGVLRGLKRQRRRPVAGQTHDPEGELPVVQHAPEMAMDVGQVALLAVERASVVWRRDRRAPEGASEVLLGPKAISVAFLALPRVVWAAQAVLEDPVVQA